MRDAGNGSSPVAGSGLDEVFEGNGIRLSIERSLTLWRVQGRCGAELQTAVANAFGEALPTEPNSAKAVAGGWLMSTGPRNWLILMSDARMKFTDLSRALAPCGGWAVELTHGRIFVRVRGKRAIELISKDCPLDLRPPSFPENGCAGTLYGRLAIQAQRLGGEDYRVIAPRSYARTLWQWLVISAREFGTPLDREI